MLLEKELEIQKLESHKGMEAEFRNKVKFCQALKE